MSYTTPGAILFRYIPGVGRVAVNSCGTSSISHGNVAIVDTVLGNDSTASVSGNPFKTITAAIASVSSGQSVWILPGTYTLSSGITIPSGVSITGLSLQTTVIQMSVTSSTTLLTMGESCRVENITFNLVCTGSTAGVVLKGIVFPGTTSQTAKLRTCVVTVNNSTMGSGLTNTVTGIEFSGTGALNSSVFSFNSIKGCTINVLSNGAGNKRGLLVSNSNQVSTRDTNVYVAQPTSTASTGSYVGIETADSANSVGSIQLRSTTVGVVFPIAGQSYTASDILQSYPTTIISPTYLASPGIQVGPGTDLVTKSAGGAGFSTYIYPSMIYYGLKGNITSAGSGGYLWPGTQTISAGQYPDTGLPAAYFRAQQPCMLCGLHASLNAASGGTNTTTMTVYYTPSQTTSSAAALYTGTISGTTLTVGTGPSYGAIAVGQSVLGSGIAINTFIVSGSGSTWTVYPSQTVPGATFTGSTSGTTLTASSITGTIAIGQTLLGTGVPAGTTIIAGSGSTWTLSAAPSPALSSVACTSTISITNGTSASSFTGSISSTTLTVSSSVTGQIAIGQYLAGSGVTAGTTITAGSGSTWTVSPSQTVGAGTALTTTGMLSTPFSVTFNSGDTEKFFYGASQRLNTGDRVHVYLAYTTGNGGANAAHDVSLQLDLF
jgi:hypothetical protein